MRNIVFAAIGSAALGLFAAGSASATPLSAGSSAMIGAGALSAPVENVAWRRVCNNRPVWRVDRWGNRFRTTVRECDRVWVGKRRYHDDGRYYSHRPYRPYPGHYQGGGYGGGYGNGYYAPRAY